VIGLARRLAPFPIIATIALLAVIGVVPGRAELALHVYLLVLATLALGWLVAVLDRSHPRPLGSPFDLGLRERGRVVQSLPELARLEREVTLATTTAFDVHFRLRPVLRRIAERTLQARRGIELDRDPEASSRLLGSELWELVRPDREPPRDRAAPGIDLLRLGRMVTALEQL
jgi:hypothetical protein